MTVTAASPALRSAREVEIEMATESDFLEGGSRETRAEDKTQADLVSRWLAEIELSEKNEKDWRADADKEIGRAHV